MHDKAIRITFEDSQIDPGVCPLCGQPNHCAHHRQTGDNTPCWCADPLLHFPQALLDTIPPQAKGKACICKACLMRYLKEQA